MPGYSETDEGSGDSGVITTGPSKDAVKKMDQIIQVGLRIFRQAVERNCFADHCDRISTQKLQSLSFKLECPYPS